MLRHPSLRRWRRLPLSQTRLRTRGLSDQLPNRYRPPPPGELEEPIPIQAEFRDGIQQVASFYGRFFKYSTLSLITLASVLYVGWEGVHQYVERVELIAPPSSPAEDPYEWTDELDKWTGTPDGTDPKLGYRGRHAVRAAWMALNWSGEPNLNVIESSVAAGQMTGNAFDRQLYTALGYLSTALAAAYRSNGDKEGKQEPEISGPTVADLLNLSGAILDRIASPSALTTAKPIIQRVHAYHVANGHVNEAARLGVKLGDVCARLGENDEAVKWWKGALRTLGIQETQLSLASTGNPHGAHGAGNTVALPASPAQQRIVASALLSLSGHYASTRQFSAARDVETIGLSLIAHHLMGSSLSSSSPRTPDRLLHELFLYYRATILLMHYAEVSFAESQQAQRSDSAPESPTTSSKWSIWSSKSSSSGNASSDGSLASVLGALQGATLSAEEIATILTSSPDESEAVSRSLRVISTSLMQGFHASSSSSSSSFPSTISASQPQIGIPAAPSPPTTPLNASFTTSSSSKSKSKTLARPAETLLRQAKRASAQALQLRGILLEKKSGSNPNSDVEAMEAYERALAWVGGGPDGRAGNDAIESEWKQIWERYVTVRERVLKKDSERARS